MLAICISVQFSHSVVSDSLQPHELQHTRPPCPSWTPGVRSNSCPSSRWCLPTISSSVIHFSSCPQSFKASGSILALQFSPWAPQPHLITSTFLMDYHLMNNCTVWFSIYRRGMKSQMMKSNNKQSLSHNLQGQDIMALIKQVIKGSCWAHPYAFNPSLDLVNK